MMHQHDAEKVARLIEHLGEARQLRHAEPPGGHERSRRHCGRKRDQRHIAAPAQIRKAFEAIVAAHVSAPELGRHRFSAADIDVVIARHDGDVTSIAECREPGTSAGVFVRQREIDEVAGDRDVVETLRFQVAGYRIKDFGTMNGAALAIPVYKAQPALAHKLRKPRRRSRMQVGKMGKREHRGMVADTS